MEKESHKQSKERRLNYSETLAILKNYQKLKQKQKLNQKEEDRRNKQHSTRKYRLARPSIKTQEINHMWMT
jgi:hypothetical protein